MDDHCSDAPDSRATRAVSVSLLGGDECLDMDYSPTCGCSSGEWGLSLIVSFGFDDLK
jgi:hypothetical protein